MRVNRLTKIVMKLTGMKPQDFAVQVLGLKYTTYCYRVRHEQLRGPDVRKLLEIGMTYEQIFMVMPKMDPLPQPPSDRIRREFTPTVSPPIKPAPEPSGSGEEQKKELPKEAPFELARIEFPME